MTLINSRIEVKTRVIHSQWNGMEWNERATGKDDEIFNLCFWAEKWSWALSTRTQKTNENAINEMYNVHVGYSTTWHSFYLHMKTMEIDVCEWVFVCVTEQWPSQFYEVVNKQISQNVIMNARDLRMCDLHAGHAFVHIFYPNIGRSALANTHTRSEQIMAHLNFMVFLCLGLRFNYNAIYFNFGGWHTRHKYNKPYFRCFSRKNKSSVFSPLAIYLYIY